MRSLLRTLRSIIPTGALLALLIARPAGAWPLRAGLELQGGLGVAGTDLGIGSSVLGGGDGAEWIGRVAGSLSSGSAGGAEWRAGLALQRWVIRGGTDVTYTVQSGPSITTETVTFTITQTVQELVLPLEVRLRPAPTSAWFLDLGPEVAVLLSARQRSDAGSPRPAQGAARRGAAPSASEAGIFEEVGTFGGSRDVGSRFSAVSVGVVAGLGREWGQARPMQLSLRVQQGLLDQERASRAVVRPTRLLLGWGVTFRPRR